MKLYTEEDVDSTALEGARIAVLPTAAVRVRSGAGVLFYFHGTFYERNEEGGHYLVHEPVSGTEVPYVPEGASIVEHDGVLYYLFDGVHYRPVVKGDVTTYLVMRF